MGMLAAFLEQEIRRLCEANTWTSLCSQRATRSCPSLSRVAPPSLTPMNAGVKWNLPEYLGYLVGDLSGPLAPDEETRYRKEQAQQEYLRRTVAV